MSYGIYIYYKLPSARLESAYTAYANKVHAQMDNPVLHDERLLRSWLTTSTWLQPLFAIFFGSPLYGSELPMGTTNSDDPMDTNERRGVTGGYK